MISHNFGVYDRKYSKKRGVKITKRKGTMYMRKLGKREISKIVRITNNLTLKIGREITKIINAESKESPNSPPAEFSEKDSVNAKKRLK